MASVQEIRQRLRDQRIEALRRGIEPLLAGRTEAEVWLFGSLLAAAPERPGPLVARHLPRCHPSGGTNTPMTPRLQAWLRQAVTTWRSGLQQPQD